MSSPIVPVSAQSEKSDPAPKAPPRLKPKHQMLQDWIEDTEYAIGANPNPHLNLATSD